PNAGPAVLAGGADQLAVRAESYTMDFVRVGKRRACRFPRRDLPKACLTVVTTGQHCFPVGAHGTPSISASWSSAGPTRSPVCEFQSRAVPLTHPVTRTRPSPPTAAAQTFAGCRSKGPRGLPEPASQRPAVPFSLAVTKQRPSGLIPRLARVPSCSTRIFE